MDANKLPVTQPLWFDAQIELLRLHKRMAELEAHVQKHGENREEFSTCEDCDLTYYLVRSQLENHIESWAAIWAKQAVELHVERGRIAVAMETLIRTFHLDGAHFSRYGTHGESVVRHAKAAIRKGDGVVNYSAASEMDADEVDAEHRSAIKRAREQ